MVHEDDLGGKKHERRRGLDRYTSTLRSAGGGLDSYLDSYPYISESICVSQCGLLFR